MKSPAEVILTHSGADFDGLASMICARYLYPQATPMLTGSPDPMVREFLALYQDHFPIPYARNVDRMQLSRIVLVDVQVPSRLGDFRERVVDPNIEVHIWDHHPPTLESIQGDFNRIENVGATTTLLVSKLMEKEASAPAITSMEATLFALGIYEETGSLTFVDTTPQDARAVAWLLEHGANTSIVSDYLYHALTDEQRRLFNDLVGSLQPLREKGMRILMATAQTDRYVGELAIVVHRLMDLERADGLFCVVRMQNRIYVVGRSRENGPDVGQILQHLGGGGHPHAASAAMREDSIADVCGTLLELLRDYATPPLRAADAMTAPVQSIELTTAADMEAAQGCFVRFGFSALPVTDNGKLVGMLSRRDVDKALHHGLGGEPVTRYLGRPSAVADPSASVSELQRLFANHNVDRVPIVQDGRLMGIVTRTDLLEALHKSQPLVAEPDTLERLAVLPPLVQELLRQGGQVGDDLGVSVYAVGGFVRDVLLRVENLDVDVVVEGDGIAFARKLGERLGGRCRPHEKFGTAVVMTDDFKIDVASTRVEFYTRPAALPDVVGSTLKQDLFRRDFTINAMAIKVNAAEYGKLFDFFGARRDLYDGVIRILHNLSFIDDPTRIFRAIKFEQRYHFRMEPHTERLLRQAISQSMLEQVSAKRIREEFVQILAEARPLPAIMRMDQLRVLRLIHPQLHVTPRVRALLEEVTATLAQYGPLLRQESLHSWTIYFRALCSGLPEQALHEVAERYHISGQHHRLMFLEREQVRFLMRRLFRQRLLPSEIHRLLNPLSLEMVLYLLARCKARDIKEKIVLYLERLRLMKPLVSGRDLLRWGVEEGPRLGEALRRLFDGQLDGKIHTREEAREYLQEHDIVAAWS